MGNGLPIPGCKADTLPHLVTRVRTSGATPTPLYAVKTCTGTTIPLLNSTSVSGCAVPSDTESGWVGAKVKVTIVFVEAIKRIGGAEVQLHALLFWTPNGGVWLHSPCRFTPAEISSDMNCTERHRTERHRTERHRTLLSPSLRNLLQCPVMIPLPQRPDL